MSKTFVNAKTERSLEKMHKNDDSNGWIVRRVLVLIVLVIIAILPKIIKLFQDSTVGLFEKILGSLLVMGSLFLIWFIASLVFMVLNAIAWTAWTKISKMTFESDKEKKLALESAVTVAAIVAAVVVIAAQFVDSWGINADTLKFGLSSLFPFLR